MDPVLSAESEADWFIAYNNRDWPKVAEAIKRQRKAEFGVDIPDAIAHCYVRAGKSYIGLKKAQEEGNTELAKAHEASMRADLLQHRIGIGRLLEEKGE